MAGLVPLANIDARTERRSAQASKAESTGFSNWGNAPHGAATVCIFRNLLVVREVSLEKKLASITTQSDEQAIVVNEMERRQAELSAGN
jgi:hypothetical protein